MAAAAAPEGKMKRIELDFYAHAEEMFRRMREGGVLCTVVDRDGNDNVLTLGWGQAGPSTEPCPIITVAITPLRYSFRFIEETGDFVIAVPDDSLRAAADLCGTKSGRDMDKFAAAGLTKVRSAHVGAASIAECPVNVECRVYTKFAPPHEILPESHRKASVANQHTIYFARILGAYRYEKEE